MGYKPTLRLWRGGGSVDLFDELEPLIRLAGYELLEVRLSGEARDRMLLVRVDRLDEQPASVSDLSRLSRLLGLELDKLGQAPGAYRLEVESPGPKRPLFTRRHFERFTGLLVRVHRPEVFRGRVGAVDDTGVTFRLTSGEERVVSWGDLRADLAEWPDKPR